MRRGLCLPAAAIVAPHTFVKAIVEVEIFKVFEFGASGGEEFFDDANMRVHRTADIKKQEHLYRVAPFGTGFDVEVAMFGRGADGAVEVQLFVGTVAGPTAQTFRATLMLRVPSSTESSRFGTRACPRL